MPISATGNEDTNINITGVEVYHPDVDPSGSVVTATLTVTKGGLTVVPGASGGLDGTNGSIVGNGTNTLILTGTLDQINATIAADMQFQASAGNFNGLDTFAWTVHDTLEGDASEDFNIIITPVNDAPTAIGSNTETLAATNEDVLETSGAKTISTLFLSHFSDAVDQVTDGSSANAFAGVVVTANGSNADAGQWQYLDDVTWTDIGSVSASAGVALSADAQIRFKPTGNYNGAAPTLTVQLVDASGGPLSDGTTGVNVTANGGTTAYSTDSVVLNHTVTAVNDAPLVTGGTATLDATNEDVSNAALTNTVSTLFSSQFADINDNIMGGSSANAFAGVAVVVNGSSSGTGQWQFWNGGSWVDVGVVSSSSAVLLGANTPLRFQPAADFNGPAPTLTVKLVDNSAGGMGVAAMGVDVSTSGGSTAYSTGTVVLDHMVTPVKDAPTVTGGSAVALGFIAEDSAPTVGETVSNLFASHFSDAKDAPSSDIFKGVAVTANAATSAQGVYQYFGGGTWHDMPAVSGGAAFVLDPSTVVRFVPAANYNGTAPALTVSLIDGSAGAVVTGDSINLTTIGGSTPYSAAMTLNIAVTPVNDAPVASGSATLTPVNEDTSAPTGQTVSALFGSHFTDTIDGDSLAGVAITGNAATTEGAWQYFNGAWTTITTPNEVNALVLAAGTLVRFLPSANFNGAVPALTAYLIDDSGGTVTIGTTLDVSVNGGATPYSDTSVDLTTSITALNDTPVVPASATAVAATEQTVATLLGSLAVSDADLGALNGGAGDFNGAGFTVQRAVANGADTFAFTAGGAFTVNGADLQVGGQTFATFISENGVLTISFTSLETTATTALVNDVINHITYTNTSDAPSASVTLDYALNDGAPGGGQGFGAATQAGGSVVVNITPVNDLPIGGATIMGPAMENEVLMAVSSLADADGRGTLHYQWQRDGADVGANQVTYALTDADVGAHVTVVISYTDDGGTPESATSDPTGAVTGVDDLPTGAVTIDGTVAENQTLTANTSALADVDGLGDLQYQWKSGSTVVGTDATYVLEDSDVGALMSVTVSYTDDQGFSNSVPSANTAAVTGVNDPHTGDVTITGFAEENQVLTADVSTLVDVDGLRPLTYQWMRGSTSVGTNQATYTLGDADVGAEMSVVVTYTDGQGFLETSTSPNTSEVANVNDAPTGGVTITGTVAEDQTLTANISALDDDDGLNAFSYQWTRGGANVGANQATYALGDADVGSVINVTVSYTDGHSKLESVSAVDTVPVVNVNDVPGGVVTITGTATQGQTLTATNTVTDADGPGLITYQWKAGGIDIGGATAPTLVLAEAQVGKLITVVAKYTDGHNTAETPTSAATTAVVNVNDPLTGDVVITGSLTENSVLTADTSAFADPDGLGTPIHYQWKSNGGNVGTDQSTYTLVSSDVGNVISLTVHYLDGHGTPEFADSGPTAEVGNVNDLPVGAVTITGTATENQVLTAVSAVTDADGLGALHYQWMRGAVAVGTDQDTYTLGDADVGAVMSVVVSYEDDQGTDESVTSATTATVAGVNDPHTGGVTIDGAATEDVTLTANTSTLADIDGRGALHYQWMRGAVAVGADQATYVLTDADVGAVMSVVVNYQDNQGFVESATSPDTAAVANVNDLPTGAVAIAGTATQGQTLTASVGSLADVDGLTTVTYQWQADGSNIGGATGSTLVLTEAQVGKVITVVGSYTDGHSTPETSTSLGTSAVGNVNDVHTGVVSITGTATQGQTLTASNTLADLDGLGAITYQWKADGSNIGGATGSTLVLSEAQVGKAITVVASYTDVHSTPESEASTATGLVVNVNDAPTGGVSITGTQVLAQVLTANTSALVDADGLGTLHYQWQRDSGSGYANVGTDQDTYTLGSGDLSAAIRVVTSYTDGHGAAETVTSSVLGSAPVAEDPVVVQPPTTGVVDGVPVQSVVTTASDGTSTETLTVPVITSGRPDQSGQPTLADIPLGGAVDLLTAHLPIGVGLQSEGSTQLLNNTNALVDLISRIQDNTSSTLTQQLFTDAATSFLASLGTGETSLVRAITLNSPTGSGPLSVPLQINGSTGATGPQTALIIDASQLPTGSVLELNNVDFAAVVGAVTLRGGDGQNYVIGDDANQNIMLGADDDILHGGGGDDIVGSAGGNDKVYGDAGNDTVFGGVGDDFLDGGTGLDVAQMAGARANYHFSYTDKGLVAFGFEGDDTIVNVESLKFSGGTEVTNLKALVADTTSVAVLTYQFFTGKTPTGAGLEYLVHAADTVNARDLNDAYYQQFNIENRYINFTVNLASPQGEGGAFFSSVYGQLTMDQVVAKAYTEIFGTAITQTKVDQILDADIGGGMTREGYFQAVSGSAMGAKAAVIGWLLAEAVKADTGRYAQANDAFLADLSDGDGKLHVDLVAVYGDGHAWSPLG